MPTNSVKDVFGPLQDLKQEIKLRVGPRTILLAAGVSVCLLVRVAGVQAQTAKVELTVKSVLPARVQIRAELPNATNALSFRNAYAGNLGLGERVENLIASDTGGQSIPIRRLAPGEFQSNEKFSRITYDVNVSLPAQPSQLSHVSSLDSDRGVLMLADLLPQHLNSVSVSVVAPKNWKVAANIKEAGKQFVSDNPQTTIFLVGPRLQEKRHRVSSNNFSLITSNAWPFSGGEALSIAQRILAENSRITRSNLKGDTFLILLPYPGDAGPEKWSAETRGNTVVLVLGQKGSRKRVLAKLGIVLSHELFHLWIPNALSLQGEYDWFFEGFTLYQALRIDLRLGLITFDNYLDTIGRVWDAYQANREADRVSLIEASERRWTNSTSLVYEKGMLVAFVYDLALRRQTDCAESLENVYADLFQLPTAGQANANETIIRLLTRSGMESFARDHIETAAPVSLSTSLAPYGIELQPGAAGRATKLLVRTDADESQRKLLQCIGYKN